MSSVSPSPNPLVFTDSSPSSSPTQLPSNSPLLGRTSSPPPLPETSTPFPLQLNSSQLITPATPPPIVTPPMASSPPPSFSPTPPNVSPPLPPNVSPPPRTIVPPPASSSPPPANAQPPSSSPPPPPLPNTPPPQPSNPPASPLPDRPISSPPPLPPSSPPISQPPPSVSPPRVSPPPQPPSTRPSAPPGSSPPSTSAEPPQSSSTPPSNPATPPVSSRSPPATPPSSNSPPRSTPPPSRQISPPPLTIVSLSPPPPPSRILVPPSNANHNNNSDSNAPERSQSTRNDGMGIGGTVAIVVAVSLLLLGIFGIAACCVWKRKKKDSRLTGGHVMPTAISSSSKSDSSILKVQISAPNTGIGSSSSGISNSPHEPGGLGNSRLWFTYEELVDATDGFSADNRLGEGGFGSVYKGRLADGREVAVKQLKIGGGQGEREFRSEVEIISRIHHRYLVSLVGYCISDDRRLLVYDYLPNDTLYFHLHGKDRPVMDWAIRVKIATGAARGIAYLHEDCHPRIIHRDIKSSNILLDNNFEARVADFGLAKLAMDANTHITTRVMGTFGYMAPEYASSGKLTDKSDVYSFGVVLLELITGRKPVDTSQPLGEESLVEWARPLFSHAVETGDFSELVDPKLEGNYVDTEMFRLIEAAAACVRHASAKRPKMGQVVRALDSMETADLTNGMKVGESEIYNFAQQSEEIRFLRRVAFGSQNFSTDFFGPNSWSGEAKSRNSYGD